MSKSTNAGVEANVGMEFQKHCVLFLILDDYGKYSNDNYFILLEHHEDIIIGINNLTGVLDHVDAYQAKKSTNKWSLSGLYEVIFKLTDSAICIVADPITKTNEFTVKEYFLTNNTIELKVKEKKETYAKSINETNEIVRYIDLDPKIKSKIESKITTDYFATPNHINQLDNLTFGFIDLPRKSQSQEDMLIGKIKSVFGDQIEYHEAAYKTIMKFLGKCDKEYNQGNQALLSDPKKRIESSEIIKLFKLICTNVKAYKLWRSKQDQISNALSVSIIDRQDFKFHYESSFDKFKDLKEVEHRKILSYVNSEKSNFGQFTTEEDCLKHLNQNILKKISTLLLPLQLSAALYAAFIEISEL